MSTSYKKIIIIGAPRSGTNMLRDLLCNIDGVGTWPCDEINYIWKHGNIGSLTDELSPVMATTSVIKYIRNQFNKFAHKEKLGFVVEKTCANSLRVDFVHKVFPEAKFIFIVRDGIDAVGSSSFRLTENLFKYIPYIINKIKYIPFTDLPYYSIRYFINMVNKIMSKEKKLAFWGPQFIGIDKANKQYSLEEVCALQWKKCVDLSEDALSKMNDDKVIRTSYESIVLNPELELSRILTSLNIPFLMNDLKNATHGVTSNNIGKGRKTLSIKKLNLVSKILSITLKKYGY